MPLNLSNGSTVQRGVGRSLLCLTPTVSNIHAGHVGLYNTYDCAGKPTRIRASDLAEYVTRKMENERFSQEFKVSYFFQFWLISEDEKICVLISQSS